MENPTLWEILIPVIFLSFAGTIKSLVKAEWSFSNFYLGVDAALAALSNALIFLVDMSRQMGSSALSPSDLKHQAFWSAISIVVSIAILLWCIAIQQKLDGAKNDNQRLWRGILLGVMGDLLGGASLGLSIFVKFGS